MLHACTRQLHSESIRDYTKEKAMLSALKLAHVLRELNISLELSNELQVVGAVLLKACDH